MSRTVALTKLLRKLAESKVLSGALKYSSALTLAKVVTFLLLPVWTAFLGPEDFGIVGTVRAYAMLLVPLVALGVPAAVVRQYHAADGAGSGDWPRYFSSNLYFLGALSAAVVGLGLLVGPRLWGLTGSELAFSPFFQIALIGVPFAVFLQLVQSNHRARQEHTVAVTIDLGISLGPIVFALVFVVGLGAGPEGYLAGGLAALAVVALAVLFVRGRELLVPRFAWGDVRGALRYGMPLVPHVIAGVVFSVSDRIMLERMCGLGVAGVYNLAFQFAQMAAFLILATNQSWSPRFYQILNSEDPAKIQHSLRRYACWWVSFFAVVCGGVILFGEYLVYLLTPESYHGAGVIIPALTLGYFFQGIYFIGVNPLFYHKKTSLIPLLTASTAVGNVGLNLLLIPALGAVGAAVATLSTFVVVAAVANVVGHRFCRVSYPLLRLSLVVGWLAGLVCLAMFVRLGSLPGDLALRGAALGGLVLLVWHLLRSEGLLGRGALAKFSDKG